jgi:large subunit ribosomal protein L9
MKVILIAANPRLGKIGEIVDVKNGYAKNFLIPQKQAISFNQNNYKIFESKKEEFEKENAKNLEAASKIKAKIDGKDFIIIQNASDDGRLYGSVNSTVIANKLNEVAGDKAIVRSQIFLKKVIKEIGIHNAEIELHSEVVANVRLIVSRSESEVEALLKPAKAEKSEGAEAKVEAKKTRKSKKSNNRDVDSELENVASAE